MSSLISVPTYAHQLGSGSNRDMWEWTARIEAKPELGTTFTVIIFLGAVPDDPKEWLVSPNMVGSHSIMDFATGRGGYGGGGYGRGGGGQPQEGFVHLNHAIVERSGLPSLEPEVVVPYLKEKINWRVQKMNSEPAEVPSLEVAVLATHLTFPPGSTFPVPGPPHRYNEITYGRPGGSRES